jgi:hypothetical protein
MAPRDQLETGERVHGPAVRLVEPADVERNLHVHFDRVDTEN